MITFAISKDITFIGHRLGMRKICLMQKNVLSEVMLTDFTVFSYVHIASRVMQYKFYVGVTRFDILTS